MKKNPIRFSFLGTMVELIIRPNLTINLVTRISFIDLVRGQVKNNPNEKRSSIKFFIIENFTGIYFKINEEEKNKNFSEILYDICILADSICCRGARRINETAH